MLGRSLEHRLTPADVVGVQALVDGLRVAVCLPDGDLTVSGAQTCLAVRLTGLTGAGVEPGRPFVAREDWAWPYVPGVRRVTPHFAAS